MAILHAVSTYVETDASTPLAATGWAPRLRIEFPHGGVRGRHPPSIIGCYVTEFAPHLALDLISSGKLTCDERVVLHRVVAPGVRV